MWYRVIGCATLFFNALFVGNAVGITGRCLTLRPETPGNSIFWGTLGIIIGIILIMVPWDQRRK